MSSEKTTSEQVKTESVPLETAVQRLSDLWLAASNRILQLEGQINNMDKVREDMSIRTDHIEAQMSEWHNRTTTAVERSQQQLERVLQKFESFAKFERGTQGNIHESYEIKSEYAVPTQSILGIKNQVDGNHSCTTHIPTNEIKTLRSQTIVIPPSSAVPTFSGKLSERPSQFLMRVQEYAETVNGWDRSTLLIGISQFLRDTALEWYCQLRASYRRPHAWTEFVNLFISQFNSPIRTARQEQEWYECKQGENETINEFMVHLRALWSEHKPKETETDLIKHLLCKMRNDLLSMIGVSRDASSDEIILEA